jgi:lipoprotein-anchoring transpeptidase ErfK/SrfK
MVIVSRGHLRRKHALRSLPRRRHGAARHGRGRPVEGSPNGCRRSRGDSAPTDFRTIIDVRVAIVGLCAAALAAGCGASTDEQAGSAGAAPPILPRAAQTVVPLELRPLRPGPRRVERCLPGAAERVGSNRRAYAGVARAATTAYRQPGGRPVERFARLNVNGFDTVFGVLGVVRNAACEAEWYRVQLPIRPNGAVGYIPARAVDLFAVRTRIEVDLSERRLELYRDGRLVRRLTAAVGAPRTPTPTGRFYVNQRLVAGDPDGPWGPAALGISAFSPTLVDWAQGGPIAIHGTNNPASIGEAASNGCLRLPNDELERLFDETPAGTPVVIRA